MDSPGIDQPTLFDAANDAAAGMAQVEAGADPSWMTAAWLALLDYLRTHPTFFTDDFWRESGLEMPRELRAIGPLVRRAANAGLITKTGEYRPSVRSRMSANPVWHSTIYRGEPL